MKMLKKQLFKHVVLYALFASIFYSCNESEIASDDIQRAEMLAWENPDSALIVLNLIDTTELDVKQKACYDLALVMARAKADMDISGDNRIFKLIDYFNDEKDTEREAIATFYAGRVYQYRDDKDNANKNYLKALTLAEKTNIGKLKGLALINIGLLDFNQGYYKEAINTLKMSLKYLTNNIEYKCIAITCIGNSYFLLDQPDSAFMNYNKAIALTKNAESSNQLSAIFNNIGLVLMEQGEYDIAKKYYLRSLSLLDEKTKYQSWLNLAWIYHYTAKEDSADYYANQAYQLQNEIDIYAALNLYELLYQIEKEKKNYALALSYHEQLMDSLIIAEGKLSDLSMLEVQRKYTTKILENKIVIRDQQIVGGILLGLLVITILSFTAYYLVQAEKKKTQEVNKKLETLMNMAETYNKNEKNYRNITLEHFEILKKAALFEVYINDEDKKHKKLIKMFHKIAYGEEGFDWERLFKTINTLENGFMMKAMQFFKEYSVLKELDFRTWCLWYAGFTQEEIALLFKFSLRNIQSRIANIRVVFELGKKGDINKYVEAKIKEKYPFDEVSDLMPYDKSYKTLKISATNSIA